MQAHEQIHHGKQNGLGSLVVAWCLGVLYYVTGSFPVNTGSSISNGKADLTHSPVMADAFGLAAADVKQALTTRA